MIFTTKWVPGQTVWCVNSSSQESSIPNRKYSKKNTPLGQFGTNWGPIRWDVFYYFFKLGGATVWCVAPARLCPLAKTHSKSKKMNSVTWLSTYEAKLKKRRNIKTPPSN